MKISYDAEVDASSITFRETTVTTKHLAEGLTRRSTFSHQRCDNRAVHFCRRLWQNWPRRE
jgi:hypothetical protein